MMSSEGLIDGIPLNPNGSRGLVRAAQIVNWLNQEGIQKSDPRVKPIMWQIVKDDAEFNWDAPDASNSIEKLIGKLNSVFLLKVLSRELVIEKFNEFSQKVTEIFEHVARTEHGGKVSHLTPELEDKEPHLWGMSLCTIDGQKLSLGDSKTTFCLQAISQAITYAVALTENGTDAVHEFVGYEPSGRDPDEYPLNTEQKPHNPLTNAGALVTTALLGRQLKTIAARFSAMRRIYSGLTGGTNVSFDTSVYLSEKETNFKNWSILYKLLENQCLPKVKGMLPEKVMDLYLQMCAFSMDCEAGAVMAATLANAGVCPLTEERTLSQESVRNTLSLMLSCGLYDYSGQFAFQCGIPAKSGISGAFILVVPNVMGVCLYSPLIHKRNSVKAIRFSEILVKSFNFHTYDSLIRMDSKLDPRNSQRCSHITAIANMLYAAYYDDIKTLQTFYLDGYDLNSCDYDKRTPLHIASSEGNIRAVQFLCEVCKVDPTVIDRWGNNPENSAFQSGHTHVSNFLKRIIGQLPESNGHFFPETDTNTHAAIANGKSACHQANDVERLHVDLSHPECLVAESFAESYNKKIEI